MNRTTVAFYMYLIVIVSFIGGVMCRNSTGSTVNQPAVTEVCMSGCPCSFRDGTLECIHRNLLDKIPRLSDDAVMTNVTNM